ncbi:DUF4188 domain-containing protein [Streptomyces sp. NBC_01808]|uniref:DUF4188 domain-containing protein n=1 Tax=Streptomyces sp. NBC_01808 TaxID=2975947 RepID=UPI002DDB4570|nr:DUF4188 domain-containing protein [Streptomyces sp. NBC_01808]WSA41822.1 DUF4188 domain-containing protein [Streptomyces sp. NBC_01808]
MTATGSASVTPRGKDPDDMARIEQGRVNVDTGHGFVLFLVGMRINYLWKMHKWWPAFTAMPKLLVELGEDPELGLLGSRMSRRGRTITVVQYWRSAAHIEEFSTSQEHRHRSYWKWFNRAVGSGGDVGIWHELYHVRPGSYEARYINMPEFGLGAAFGTERGRRAEPE